MTSKAKGQSNSEKIGNLIHTVSPGTVFKSFKELYNYFELKPKNENTTNIGKHSRDAILAELSRHCIWEKKEKSNSYIIIEIFALSQPKIYKKFLNSNFYPACGYLLLLFLADKYCYEGYKVYYLTINKIMKIVYLCNDNYSKTKLNSAKQDSESIYFISEVRRYLYKVARGMLVSLRRNNFLDFVKCYILIDKNNNHRKATDEETTIIDEYYKVILNKYNIEKKQSIQFSRHKKQIDAEFEEHLGYRHYISNQLNLTADLASKAEHLRTVANLNDNCGAVVNSLVCSDLYSLVFEKVISKRNSQPKKPDLQLFIDEFNPELVDEYIAKLIDKFIKEGVSISKDKYNYIYNFNSDDDIVKNRIESLIELFISIDDKKCEHEINQ